MLQNRNHTFREEITPQNYPLMNPLTNDNCSLKNILLKVKTSQKYPHHSSTHSTPDKPHSPPTGTNAPTSPSKPSKKPLSSQMNNLSTFWVKSSCQQKFKMQAESPQLKPRDQWSRQQHDKKHLSVRHKFLTLNQDLQFKMLNTLNDNNNLLTVYAQLVFNNGLPVTISSSHQLLFNRTLNHTHTSSFRKVVFNVDQSPQTLIFSSKAMGIRQIETADREISMIEKDVLSRKKTIITLLALTGVQMDAENKIMREMLKLKKNLKKKLQNILQLQNYLEPEPQSEPQTKQTFKNQEMVIESQKSGVVTFGAGTNNSIELCQNLEKIPKPVKKKKYEGGYFIIQNFYFTMTLNNSQPIVKNLCKKTLKEKKKIEDRTREINQEKMRKELEIVNSIKNKEHLIQYYCQNNVKDMEYVLMDQYQHSLQEYIYFYGDSLEMQNKINISKQLVEAVIHLHQSGVVHRDLKPSNILIQDSFGEKGQVYDIKIIDFGQSYSSKIKNNYENDYGCSHPYSPLECGFKRGTNIEYAKAGIQNKEIDYWSVGINLHEIFFRKIPLSYSRPFQTDIVTNWRSQLLLIVNQRQKYGLSLVEDIITIISLKLVKYHQQKRMKLPLVKQILELLEEYVQNLMIMVDHQK